MPKRVAKPIEDEIEDEIEEEEEYEDEEEYEYEERSRLVPFLLSAVALLAFGGLGWYAYQAGDESMSSEELALVEADQTVIKERPLEAGGMQFPHQDKSVFETIAGSDTTMASDAQVVNSAEAPMAVAVPPAEGEAAPVAAAATAPVADAPVAAVAPTEEAPAAVAAPVEEALTNAIGVTPTEEAPTSAVSAIEPAAGKPEEKPVESVKEAAPEPKPIVIASVKAPEAKTPPIAKAGKQTIQLGAFKSEADAKAAWKKVSKVPALSGKSPNIVRADLGDKGIFYRLRVSGVDAKSTCASLAGKSPCMPVK